MEEIVSILVKWMFDTDYKFYYYQRYPDGAIIEKYSLKEFREHMQHTSSDYDSYYQDVETLKSKIAFEFPHYLQVEALLVSIKDDTITLNYI